MLTGAFYALNISIRLKFIFKLGVLKSTPDRLYKRWFNGLFYQTMIQTKIYEYDDNGNIAPKKCTARVSEFGKFGRN